LGDVIILMTVYRFSSPDALSLGTTLT